MPPVRNTSWCPIPHARTSSSRTVLSRPTQANEPDDRINDRRDGSNPHRLWSVGLFRCFALVWEVAGRYQLPKRPRAILCADCFVADHFAGTEPALLFAAPVLLSQEHAISFVSL